ncbi:MAG: Lrp/AsnC family transcriptional regulator [Rubrivivax sp.]|nr:Lrp/AsnC family transcriptional regulator [Rubrivivax sp.]
MKEIDQILPLDRVDLRILALLQADASLTNQSLAAKAHVSPATCLRRMRRLLDTGVIARRVAVLDPAAIGQPLEVVCEVTLDRQGVEHLDAFESRAVAHAAVRQCYRVSPGPDFVLFASVRDMPAWSEVVSSLLTQDANVRNVKSFFCVRRAKFETSYDLAGAPAG